MAATRPADSGASGGPGRARELAAFLPDCFVLCRRLLHDRRVPRRGRVALALVVPYLALPFDLIPDFIPVLGQLDDALLVAAALTYLVRLAGPAVVAEHWPGSPRGLDAILRVARGATVAAAPVRARGRTPP